MEYTVETSKEVFEIKVKGSKSKFSLPAWDRIPARVAFAAAKAQRKGEDVDAGFVLFDYIDEQCPGLMDIISEGQLVDIVKAWRGDGVELGE